MVQAGTAEKKMLSREAGDSATDRQQGCLPAQCDS